MRFPVRYENFPFLGPVDPFGGAFGDIPVITKMILCRGKTSACLRQAASAKAGAEPFDDEIISVGSIARIHPR